MFGRLFNRTIEWRVDSARPAAAAEIAALHGASFARGWSTDEIEGLLADRAVVADVLRASAGNAAIAGFSLSRVAADEAELLTIAVARRWRGKGGSRELLARHMARVAAAGAKRIFLEVDEDNVAARALYARFGFHEVGRRAAYYTRADGGRGNALILAREPGGKAGATLGEAERHA